MATVTPAFNPSLPLIGGWPFSQTAGDGNLGNVATAEVDAREPSSNAAAAGSNAAKNAANLAHAQGEIATGKAGRIV